ncbi:MAG: phosphatase PAP2 family protein [Minwuia sp.]|uniref:phosphatase PAP2 family protein n=1 Tax=Minwuia sp. TaxID=2493630 RepID=UPI003A88AABC
MNGLTRMRDICITAALALAPIAIFFPLDAWVAGLFYEGGGSFWLTESWVGDAFHDVLRPAFYWVLIALVLLLAFRSARMKAHVRLTVRRVIYVAAVLGIGLGLVTNLILKDQFDRPRPLHTVEYGGTKAYQPPILPAKGCERNCSFVSGDAAAGFAMVALPIAFASGRRRRKLIRAALWFGVAVGSLRMLNGSHYFFDVIYAGLINVGLAAALYVPILKLDRRRLKAAGETVGNWGRSLGPALGRVWNWLRYPR